MNGKNKSHHQMILLILIVLFIHQTVIISGSSSTNIQLYSIKDNYTFISIPKTNEVQITGYADLDIILLEVWWADINNGTLYVRYLVENKGETFHNPIQPVRLNISLTINSNEDPFAYINQSSFIDPNTWYFSETLGGCVQIPLHEKPNEISAHVNPNLEIPEKNLENNFLSTPVYNGIIIKGQVKKQDHQGFSPISNCHIRKCNETSLQSKLYIRFDTNDSGQFILSLYPKKPLDVPHRYHLLFTDGESTQTLLFETPLIQYNTTLPQNITFQGSPPNQPMKPLGFSIGIQNRPHFFLTSTFDKDDDEIWYKFKWDYDVYSQWISPFQSFHLVSLKQTWSKSGMYPVKVIAKDDKGMLSSWSEKKTVKIFGFGEISKNSNE